MYSTKYSKYQNDMMYREIKKIKGAYYKVVKQYLFTLESDNSSFFLYDLNDFRLIQSIGEDYGGGIYIVNKCVIGEDFKGVNLTELDKAQLFIGKNYYYSTQNDKYIIAREFIGKFEIQYILIQRESLAMIETLSIEGSILIFYSNGMIISRTGDSLYTYIYNRGLAFIWTCNISAFYSDKEEVKISEVKKYNGSIIVVTTAGVLRLSAEDGSVIWKADGYARTMEIVDNIGYVCTGLSLLRINLDTGEESGYGWENHRLPDFTYKGKNYWPIGHKVVFHDGLLWYSVYSSGDSFLIAINPQNGNYEWIHYVDTNEKTDAPQFDEDKMFLWDTGNILHVYEKE